MKDNDLKKYVDAFFDKLVLYDDYYNGHQYKGLLKAGIDLFLENETSYNAYEIYQTFLMIYQITEEDKSDKEKTKLTTLDDEPNTILDLVEIMKKYEENTGDLIDKQRDHFIHSVNVFLLGLAIYSQNEKYRKIFMEYIVASPYTKYYKIKNIFSDEEFLYRWGIAALFHDIGYPVEIIGKQLKKFLNDGIKSISDDYKTDTAIDFKDFNEFNTIVKMKTDFNDDYRNEYEKAKFLDLFKPTDIMANKIVIDFSDVDIEELKKHLNDFVNIMGEYGFIDHGFFSAILVLNSYGYLVQKYSKNFDFFYYPIVDSATAILLHNYYRNVLMKKPFCQGNMNPTKSPLSYLLILCDELQEWNRQPFGVLDKKRGHINELDLDITEDKLSLKYIVHHGSMGLGFSEEKEELLRNVLDIKAIFKDDISITTVVEQDNVMREIMQFEAHSPNILLRNVEKLAVEAHNQYIESVKAEYAEAKAKGEISDNLQAKFDSLCEFNDLSPQLKIANIRQARSIPKKLSMIGCEMALPSDSRDEVKSFSSEEIKDLAIVEHDEWCEEKRGTGWTYGEVKDIDNFITPYLVPWQELEPEIQQYDVDAVKNIPNMVKSIGLKIVRTNVRLLTFKMHEFYNKTHDAKGFEELPEYIKYSNYRQADFLVKMLGELHYKIVSKDTDGETVDKFDDEVLEYLARREHDAWYKLRINLGWKYGKKRDDNLKTNPNLVPWKELDDKHKNTNKNTFSHLPQMCDEIGLKIIKTK
ncbi:RyR domain-containing protein [Methanosphaera sp. BMS]|uniref:RyR domain-containing protein n=1 Tax=Methanosphaera sp. BMS TaxID=1789762 RepID=UPI000DC1ED1B|nr:RyR domain-containing protein [Methanosphaera sp. BMS]AWX31711.1 hypothetical protein AW729_00795 [Methanosphaera sp. BMS]